MNKLKSVVLSGVAGLAAVSLPAFAAVDVTAITGAVADVGVVATAVFGVYVAIKAAKFIRRAL